MSFGDRTAPVEMDEEAQATADLRRALEDVVTIAEKLLPHCDNVGDLIGMVKLAIENDGQMRLLLSTVQTKSAKR